MSSAPRLTNVIRPVPGLALPHDRVQLVDHLAIVGDHLEVRRLAQPQLLLPLEHAHHEHHERRGDQQRAEATHVLVRVVEERTGERVEHRPEQQ